MTWQPTGSTTPATYPGWHTALLSLLLLLTVSVRAYYLWRTSGQPLWWDEAEYMLHAKALALGTPDTGYTTGRPPLLPVAVAGLFTLGLGESAARVMITMLSAASVYLVYAIGRRLFGAAAGLVAAFPYSAHYLDLFYANRILTEVPHVTLVLLGIYLLLTRRPWSIRCAGPVLVLAVLARYPAVLLVFVLVLYVLATEGFAAFRDRDYWIAAALAALVALPYAVWGYLRFGSPLYALDAFATRSPPTWLPADLEFLPDYAGLVASSLTPLLLPVFVFGLVRLTGDLLARPSRVRSLGTRESAALLVLPWIAVPLLYFSFRVVVFVDRYIVLAVPAIFLVTGATIDDLRRRLARRVPRIANAAAVSLVVAGGVLLFLSSNRTIEWKRSSFTPLRDAALWIKARTDANDIVLSQSVAQMTYYSERGGRTLPPDPDQLDRMMADAHAKFLIVSSYEEHPSWAKAFDPTRYGLRIAATFGAPAPEVYVLTAAGKDGG